MEGTNIKLTPTPMPAVIAMISALISYSFRRIRSTAKYTSTPVTTQMRKTEMNAPTTSESSELQKKDGSGRTRAMPSEAHPLRGRPTGQIQREQRNQHAGQVGELNEQKNQSNERENQSIERKETNQMSGIGDDRQTARPNAAHHLADHEQKTHNDGHPQHTNRALLRLLLRVRDLVAMETLGRAFGAL